MDTPFFSNSDLELAQMTQGQCIFTGHKQSLREILTSKFPDKKRFLSMTFNLPK